MMSSRFSVRMQFFMVLASLLFFSSPPATAQDWFRTGTGLGVEKPRVAVAEFAPRSPSSQPLSKIFGDVVRADLEYSGIIEVVSQSMNPLQSPSVPAELKHAEWNAPPAEAHMLAYGNLSAAGNDLVIEAWLSDVRNAQAAPVLSKRYRGEVTDAEIRRFAHQFADEIIARLNPDSGEIEGVGS